jgi:hypothetical protein
MNCQIPCVDGVHYSKVKRFFLTPALNKLIEYEKYISRKNREWG